MMVTYLPEACLAHSLRFAFPVSRRHRTCLRAGLVRSQACERSYEAVNEREGGEADRREFPYDVIVIVRSDPTVVLL